MRLIASLSCCAVLASCSPTSNSLGPPLAASSKAAAKSGNGYQQLYSFKGNPDGKDPLGGPLIAFNGTLYGTTAYGGANGFGAVFDITPPSGSENVVYSFQRSPDGWYPLAPLIERGGAFYGTTTGGSPYNLGSVFKVSPSGGESVVYGFYNVSEGASPLAGLVAANGRFYSTTAIGGRGFGNVFSVTTSGVEKSLYEFQNEPDGSDPQAPLLELHGIFYGTTYFGGGGSCSDGCGTVYSITKAGVERVLHSFQAMPDGATPGQSGLMADHGTLYGTTESGGTYDAGTVFEITTSGQETVLYNFKGGFDGAYPDASLIEYHGSFYGTTTYGGGFGCIQENGCGTIFKLSKAGKKRVLYRFKDKPDGFPQSPLTVYDGVIYGTTVSGGSSNDGTVFRVSP